MKKFTIVLISGLFFAQYSSVYAADNYNYTPYVGAEYLYNHTTADDLSPKHQVGGVYVGSDYSKYFSTEMFFNQSAAHKNYPQGNIVKTSYRSYGLDLLAYLPLGCEKRFSLIATTGIGEYVYKQKIYSAKHHNEHGWGYRFGAGFKYAWNQNWQVRFITRYVNFDRLATYNHAVEYSFGVEYHFNQK